MAKTKPVERKASKFESAIETLLERLKGLETKIADLGDSDRYRLLKERYEKEARELETEIENLKTKLAELTAEKHPELKPAEPGSVEPKPAEPEPKEEFSLGKFLFGSYE